MNFIFVRTKRNKWKDKDENKKKIIGYLASPRLAFSTGEPLSSFPGIRFRSLSYVTHVTFYAIWSIVGHMCLVSRGLLMLAHLT